MFKESSDRSPSSKIAKARLLSMQAQERQEYTGDTGSYITNEFPIDNNNLWEGEHNILSSKGD